MAQKWEYLERVRSRKIAASSGGVKLTEWSALDLNELGRQGWELVSVSTIANVPGVNMAVMTTEIIYTFKKPKEGGW